MWQRAIVIVYAAGVTAIAGHEIRQQYVPKKKPKNPVSKEEFLAEIRGDLDLTQGSLSKEHMARFARKPGSKGLESKEAESAALAQAEDAAAQDKKGLTNLLEKLAP